MTLKITLASGRTDYIISAPEPIKRGIAGKYDFSGWFGVFSEENGTVEGRLAK